MGDGVPRLLLSALEEGSAERSERQGRTVARTVKGARVAITLHQLTCFLATLESGSFTKAAEDLGLSQQTLSEQVRLLESRVRVPLFTRTGRGVRSTEAGQNAADQL